MSAVQISYTDQQVRIERVFSEKIGEAENEIPNTLRDLINKHDFDRRAAIAIALPDDAIFFRSIKAESVDDNQVDLISQSALEHSFPIQPDNIIAQICPHSQSDGATTSVLVAAAKRDSLYDTLNTLKIAKMHPTRVEAKIFAVHSTVMTNHPESDTGRVIIAYINESYLTLAVTQDSHILMVRNIPFAACYDDNDSEHRQQIAKAMLCEADITWQKVFGDKTNEDTRIYLAKGSNVPEKLETAIKEASNCTVVTVNPYAKAKSSQQHNDRAAICVAQGLALGLVLPEKAAGINFFEVEKCSIEPTVNLKKEIAIYAILVAAIAVISVGGLFLRLSRMESEYATVKNEITEVFKQTLPQETNIVNPLVQLDQKLQSLQKSYTLFAPVSGAGINTLETFHAITTSVPAHANIDSILITAESVRVTGACQSFELVYDWQKLLENNQAFTNIDMQNVKKDNQTQKVNFTMSISLAAGETY